MGNPVRRISEAEAVTIASGASLSPAVNLRGRVLCGVYMSAAWTAAGLTFQGSSDGVTYYNIQTDTTEVIASAAAAIYIALDPVTFLGVNFLKVRSGTSGTPVNQGADRALLVMAGQPSL